MGGTHQNVSLLTEAGSKVVAELNYVTRNEHKEVRDGIAGEGQGLSDEDESRINETAMDLNESHVLEALVLVHNPVLEKQPSTTIVRWERFLPLRTLKVLLVENDDSTRQVVSALLRNCCYEVTAVANGMEAWKVLEDLKNRVDLVLTEVLLPCLSGIGLLCKIMSHKTCKTIPVIMMSSNDSMGIVFKCLSKGAIDFLVKPIRKNELKNLWQHVWRRCHSSSGSGSESGVQGQKSMKSKSEDDSDNNAGSNDEDNDSIGLNARDGSDNGSGTQSSWTKRAVEVDSPQLMSPSDQFAGPHDSTCAQVIHPHPETVLGKKAPVNCNIDRIKHMISANDMMEKDLEISGGVASRKMADLRNEAYQADKVFPKVTDSSPQTLPENDTSNVNEDQNMNYDECRELIAQTPDQLAGSFINIDQQLELGLNASKSFLKSLENNDLSSLELSLKRLKSPRDIRIPSSDERNVLKRSNLSAFSRYPASVAPVQAPTLYGGSSVLDNCSEAAPLNLGSNGSSCNNNNDKGSTNINAVSKPAIYTSAFHPVPSRSSTIQQALTEQNIDEAAAVIPLIGQSRGSEKLVKVQHHHHHYHHHHHHHQDGMSVFARSIEANAATYSVNGSHSGSNHGSDGRNGSSMAMNNGGTNMESAIGEKSGAGGVNGGGNGAEQSRFAQREAALNKFRLKRKERNFGKKVRYQSRKRLAEQRPRVRGQFVRRIVGGENHEVES